MVGATNVPAQYRLLVSPLSETQLMMISLPEIVAACQVSSELLLTCFHSPVRSGGEAGSFVCSPPLLAGVLPQAQMDSAKTTAIRNTEIFFIFDLFPRQICRLHIFFAKNLHFTGHILSKWYNKGTILKGARHE